MNQNFITKMRKSRIDEIMNNPLSGFIVSKGFRRFLCVVAVFSSYAYLASLLVAQPSCWGHCTPADNLRWYILAKSALYYGPIAMAVSFLLLRRSMRRVTSLPDEYLDEREKANRDWAFSRGYLVIRRIGLGVALALLFITTLGYSPYTGEFARQDPSVLAVRALNKYINSLTANDAIGFYADIVCLLTFVAYSFPLILVSWRESSTKALDAPRLIERAPADPAAFATTYFRRLFWVPVGFVGVTIFYVLMFLIPSLGNWMIFGGGFVYGLVGWVFYGIYVYIWASVRSVVVLRTNAKTEVNAKPRRLALLLFTLTQVFGSAVFVLIYSMFSRFLPSDSLFPWAIAFGLLMIPAQWLSVHFMRKMAPQEA